MDYEVPYYATFSFIPLLPVMSIIFLFHHSFTIPLYMNKQGNVSKPCKFAIAVLYAV
jgi:hypothetical protein